MNVPGSNLLKLALQAITPSTVKYYAYVSRTINAIGLYETTFAASVDILGSVQAVPQSMYQQLGLDFTKNYVMFYSTQLIGEVTRDRTGDQFEFGGKRWQVESSNNWHAIDGWNGLLAIHVPEPTP